jgi:lysophospholipase L1-like esterase
MRWLAAALALGAVAMVAGCRDEPDSHRGDSYVALGDSYTSGAGLPRNDPASAFCQRSALNYPHLVAKALDARLTDVSCGGAGTMHATTPQSMGDGTFAPPQLDALGRSTDLVTVGLGYNDFNWYFDLLYGCSSAAPTDPTGHPCQNLRASGEDPEVTTTKIGDQVEATLEAVHDKAPSADVLLVGYPQLVPEKGTCPQLALAKGDYPYVRKMLELLDDNLRRAAEDGDATYVDVYSASKGHDICAGHAAWVNGINAQPGVAAPYHPFARGQRAVADLVLDALRN